MLSKTVNCHRVALAANLARWRLTWGRYDPDYVPGGLGERFVSARAAAELVPDGATGVSCGIAAFHPHRFCTGRSATVSCGRVTRAI